MNFLAALASILPQIMQAITVAETIFPNAGSGDSKLAHVVAKAKEIIAGAPLAVEHATQLMGAVEPAVKGIVEVLNATGIFSHGGGTGVAAAPVEPTVAQVASELQAALDAAQGSDAVVIHASLAAFLIGKLGGSETHPAGSTDAAGHAAASAPA